MEEILEKIKYARFTTTDEIYEKRKIIRKIVQRYDYDTLEIYKWYFFFQLCMLKNPLKRMLWDYLVKENLTVNDELDLTVEYRNYKKKCLQILNYQKKKDKKDNVNAEEIDKKPTIRITCVDDLFKI